MNVNPFFTALTLLSAAFTTTTNAAPSAQTTFVEAGAPVTRAAVTAELLRARAAGELCNNEAECDRMAASAPVSVRQQAAAQGRNVHVCQNEAECDAAPHRNFSFTREQVMAEFYRARAAGEIAQTEADNDIGRAALLHRAR